MNEYKRGYYAKHKEGYFVALDDQMEEIGNYDSLTEAKDALDRYFWQEA